MKSVSFPGFRTDNGLSRGWTAPRRHSAAAWVFLSGLLLLLGACASQATPEPESVTNRMAAEGPAEAQAGAGEADQADRSEQADGSEESREKTQTAAEADEKTGDETAAKADVPTDKTEAWDGEWLVDDNGRQYRLVEVERKPYYTILPQGRVMLPPGASYELVKATDDKLVVKIYNPDSFLSDETPAWVEARSKGFAELEDLAVSTVDRLRLTSRSDGLPSAGQWRQGFAIADIDGDGNLDIVHGPARKGDGVPKIFLGDGKGDWKLWREATFDGPSLDYGDVAVADFDGDGNLDIALAVHLRGVLIMKGDGHGHFRRWGEGLPYWVPGAGDKPLAYSSRVIAAVDWNRDGRMDLLTIGEGPRIVRSPGSKAPEVNRGERGPVLFLNGGDGTWERYDQGVGRDRIFGDGVALGDFDGDGITDFVVASNVPGATRLVKLGKDDGTWEDVSLGTLARIGAYRAVDAADLDGDGRDEILLGYTAADSDRTWWTGVDLLQYEDGTWHRQPLIAQKDDQSGITALASGDLDGDGRPDVVALGGDGQRTVLLQQADGSFSREESPELPAAQIGCRGYDATVLPLEGFASGIVMEFAGEGGSGGPLGLGAQAHGCPGQGSLEVWAATPVR